MRKFSVAFCKLLSHFSAKIYEAKFAKMRNAKIEKNEFCILKILSFVIIFSNFFAKFSHFSRANKMRKWSKMVTKFFFDFSLSLETLVTIRLFSTYEINFIFGKLSLFTVLFFFIVGLSNILYGLTYLL